MSSLTNQIIANIKKTTDGFNLSSYINSENVICIDSSFNRIGINTKNPQYSLHISGDTVYNSIYTYDIYSRNMIKSIEISTNFIDTYDISCNSGYYNHLYYNDISGNIIKTHNLIADDITIPNIYISDISTQYLDVSNIITTYNLNVLNNITTNTINANNFNFNTINLNKLVVYNDATIYRIINTDLSNLYINTTDISTNFLTVNKKAYFADDVCFNNIFVMSDASFNNITTNNIIAQTISTETIIVNTISSETMQINNIVSGNTTIISNGTFGDPQYPINAIFNDVSINKLDISNIYVSQLLQNTNLTDLSSGQLILPKYNNGTNNIIGNIALDVNSNNIKVYNNNLWNNVNFSSNYGNLTLDTSVSGNNIIYNSFTNSYSIDNSDNLLLSGFNNYKYIPIKLQLNTNKFNIINNNTLNIIDVCHNDIFELQANISIKYLNKIPGDVEPNTYKFGIYPNYNSGNIILDSIDNSFVEIYNTVIAFDNSFNYSSSHISYIGPLGDINNILFRSGFIFYLSSDKDIRYININSFYCTIKQIN